MKVKISEVNKMIKEEFQKMLEQKKLSSRLAQINEALSQMNEEDAKLNEVEAGGETKVASHGWTGKPNGDVKFKPEFEKIGSHLKEDETDAIEGGMETGAEDAGAEDAGVEVGAEVDAEKPMEIPVGEFEAKFAEIGKAIDAKLSAEAGMGVGAEMSDEPKGEDFEEVEVDGPGSEVSVDSEEMDETSKTEIKEEVPASQHLNPEAAVNSTEEDSKLKGDVQESVDEPIEGESPVQQATADTVNDNMEKDTHVKESKNNKGEVITEAKTAKGNIFTEGLDDKKKASLLAEMNRMNKFAGLSKDDDEK